MPQTRHYEMKDSGVEWIGRMPRHWRIERAKFHFRQSFERGNSTPELLAATQKHGMYPQRLLEGVVQVMAGTDLQQFKSVHINDFVISLRSFQGGFERSDYEGVCSPAYQVFHADKQYDVKWLKWFFKNDMFIDAMNALTVGIREGRNIKFDDFANSLLPVPPLSEQTAIAAYLDKKCATIDAIIAEAKASIEEYKSWKASVIFETVTKGLNPYAEMKDSGVEWIGLIPGHWVVKRLKYVAVSLSKGNGITKDETAEDGDTPCVRYGEIYAKYNQSFMECQTRTYKDIITSPKYFTYGDILITCTGELVEEIGKSVAYLGSEKCLAGGDIIVLKHTQNASFLNYALNCNYAQSQKSCDKAKLKVVHISAYDVGNIWMALPPLPEQTAIASYLDSKCAAIDSVIAEKEALISDLETYKRSLIFEVVTGKRRVC